MEDGLRDHRRKVRWWRILGLNPCFNGRWSASLTFSCDNFINGFVLILVLMEDGLREGQSCWLCQQRCYVLILVLMEDGLREQMNY